MKKIRSYSSYAVSSSAFWFTHTSGYPRNSNMFLKKNNWFFSKCMKCQKTEKGTLHSFFAYTVQVGGPFAQALMGPQFWMFQLSCPFPLQVTVAPSRFTSFPWPGSVRSNLAATAKANDVFCSKFRDTFTKEGEYALANWLGSNLFRHYQRELLCRRHRKYNIIVTHSQMIMFTYSVTLKVASFQSPKKALEMSLPSFPNYLIRNAGICYININILVNACCLLG